MLKNVSLALLALTISVLGARIVAWVTGDARVPVPSGTTIAVITIAFFLSIVVKWFLETQKLISLNWWWHRREFFREISRTGTLGTEKILKDPNQSEDELLIEVMQDGNRRNLVRLLHERLKNRDQPRQFLILGEAGSGKSTALEQLRLRMLFDGTKWFGIGKPIPILAPLGDSQTKLLDYTRYIFNKESRKLSAVLEKLLQEGRMVLLLDALDEALGSNVLREIDDLLSSHEYRKLAAVITGRRGEYEKDLPADLEIFSVEDLSDEAVLSLARRAIAAKNLKQSPSDIFSSLEQNQLLGEGGLGRNPFWLDLILKGETFSNSKTEIFASALKELFDREWSRVGSKRLWVAALPKDEQFLHTKNSLAELALQISTRQQGEQIDGEDALKIIENYLSRQTRIEKLRPQDVLWLARDELLINFDDLADKDRWPPVRFRHRLIREYLTAVELSAIFQSALQTFEQHAGDVNWWETLSMLRSLAVPKLDFKKRKDLINGAYANSQDPHRLFFASAMLESIDSIGDGLKKPVMAALVASLDQGVTSNHVEAAVSIANFAPSKLVDFVKDLIDRNDHSLTATVKDLLKQILVRQATVKGNSAIFAGLLGNPWVQHFAKPILVEIGSAVTLRVTDVLRDSDFGARWHAAEVLGEIGDTRAVEPLIELLGDSNDTVQRSAIESLGKLKDTRALVRIAKLYSLQEKTDLDFLLKPTIIRALGNFGPEAVDELIRMLKSDDITILAFAQRSLRQIGPPASGALLEVLDSKLEYARWVAVTLLGEFRQVEAIEPLIGLLDSEESLIKTQAADSLVLIGEPAVEPLIAALTGRPLEIRKNAAKVLGRIGGKRALEPLIRILQDRGANDSSANDSSQKSKDEALLRVEAAEALGNIGDLVALDALREAKEKDRLVVKLHAIAALVQLGNPEQLDELLNLLQYPDLNVQYLVVTALGRIKSPQY
jgi:HEAT repeat protein